MERKIREAYFSLWKLLATILGLTEVNCHHFVHMAHILAHVSSLKFMSKKLYLSQYLMDSNK